MFTLEYEQRGLDYYWNLISDNAYINVGRGIVPMELWNDFISLFVHHNEVLNIRLQERRIT